MHDSRFVVAGALALGIITGLAGPTQAGLPSCPSGGATLTFSVNNRSGAVQSVTLSGSLVSAACTDSGGILPDSYSQTVTCGTGVTNCGNVTFSSREPGVWNHTVTVTVAGQPTQTQSRRAVVIGSTNPNNVSWTVFKSVLPVDLTTDPSSGTACPTTGGTKTCSFRQAISTATSAQKPVLIRFDSTVFPAGTATTVTLSQTTTMGIAGDVTIDATDPNGNPTFRGDPNYRTLRLTSTGSILRFDGADSFLIGLSIVRPTLSNGANPLDIILFNGGNSKRNHVQNSKIDGGGANLTTPSAAHDCVEGISGSGGPGFSSANFVENSEVFHCPDKAVKVTTLSYLCVVDSYLHNNLDAGAQATLSGNIEVFRTIVEKSGYNSSSLVNSSANGLAANGKDSGTPTVPSVLNTNGNIVRTNPQRAISVRELSTASLNNDVACGTTGSGTANGLAIFGSTDSATATVRGSAFVYNGRNGATLSNSSTGDFGTSSQNGRNAFMHNNKDNLSGHDFNNTTSTPSTAVRNEWNGSGCGNGSSCSPDVLGSVTVSPVLAHDDSLQVGENVLSFIPTNPKEGQLVHIIGSGFDAVQSYPSSGTACTASTNLNTCPPTVTSGVCVQAEVAPGLWATPHVRAVTPTRIVIEMPALTCSKPIQVKVTQVNSSNQTQEAKGILCTN